jgi:hypothetical protein
MCDGESVVANGAIKLHFVCDGDNIVCSLVVPFSMITPTVKKTTGDRRTLKKNVKIKSLYINHWVLYKTKLNCKYATVAVFMTAFLLSNEIA